MLAISRPAAEKEHHYNYIMKCLPNLESMATLRTLSMEVVDKLNGVDRKFYSTNVNIPGDISGVLNNYHATIYQSKAPTKAYYSEVAPLCDKLHPEMQRTFQQATDEHLSAMGSDIHITDNGFIILVLPHLPTIQSLYDGFAPVMHEDSLLAANEHYKDGFKKLHVTIGVVKAIGINNDALSPAEREKRRAEVHTALATIDKSRKVTFDTLHASISFKAYGAIHPTTLLDCKSAGNPGTGPGYNFTSQFNLLSLGSSSSPSSSADSSTPSRARIQNPSFIEVREALKSMCKLDSAHGATPSIWCQNRDDENGCVIGVKYNSSNKEWVREELQNLTGAMFKIGIKSKVKEHAPKIIKEVKRNSNLYLSIYLSNDEAHQLIASHKARASSRPGL